MATQVMLRGPIDRREISDGSHDSPDSPDPARRGPLASHSGDRPRRDRRGVVDLLRGWSRGWSIGELRSRDRSRHGLLVRAHPAFLGVIVALGSPSSALGQDARGEIRSAHPEHEGTIANAPIPPEMHVRNEGGSDGAGLCVISSILVAGRYQSIPAARLQKQAELWRIAKSRPGGYSPEKLRRLVEEIAPEERWASYVGTDSTVLDRLSAQGYALCVTMNTGSLYGYRPIHHMVNLLHIDERWAIVVDNNDPGVYYIMPAPEFRRRWIDGGTGWAWVWTDLPPSTSSDLAVIVPAIVAAIGLYLAARPRRTAA